MDEYDVNSLLCNIAEILDFWLQAPIPFVLQQKRVSIKEPRPGLAVRNDAKMATMYSPRVKPAHVVIAFHATIHNGSISLLPNAFLCNFMVNPVGITPHGLVDLAKLNWGAGIVGDRVLELIVEVTII